MDRIAGNLTIEALYPVATRDETVAAGSAVAINQLTDDLAVVLDCAAGTGTLPTLNLAIQHRADSTDTWAAVPTAALYDPITGEAATFSQVTTTASTQKLALKREQLKAQVRAVLTIAGTTPDFVCSAYLVGTNKYSAGW